MRCIVLLAAFICLIGFAGAQTISGLGEGYSSSQQSFYNQPGTSTFEPDVQNYWGTYIAGKKNLKIGNGTSDIDIWMNNFPLHFDAPLQLKATTFNGSASALTLSSTERNSQFLTRNVRSKFDISSGSSYSLTGGSLKVSEGTGVPSKDAQGKMLSSNIASLFSP